MSRLVECIPNFSEARRPEVVDEILSVIRSVPGARLLDHSSDLDHNRTVVTFAGEPAAVEEAAFLAIQKAGALIDLNHHQGAHPRLGATDVVPFVPINEVTMEECAAMAGRLGKRVGDALGIPVYLYEAAATRPDRTNLEDIRRGQYEGLKQEIASVEARRPDFGPRVLGPAGATVIGARNPLVAFNVYLTTDDVTIAKAVAKAIRQSSGGFRFVKALGLLVDGRAQVSMNLTNFRQSSVATVVEAIRREAARYGAAVHHSELVGLIPQDALIDAAVWYTQLDGFRADQILETRLYAPDAARASAPLEERPSFLDEVSAATPAPGGGSAAAYAGALGAALVEMVAGLTMGRPKYAAVEAEMRAIHVHAGRLKSELEASVEDDSAAFEAVMGATRMAKTTDSEKAERNAAIQLAYLAAAHVPLHTAAKAVHTIELALACMRDGNLNAISDAYSGTALARASLNAAASNVRINLKMVEDRESARKMLAELAALESKAEALERDVLSVLHTRASI